MGEQPGTHIVLVTATSRWWHWRRWLPKRPRVRYHIALGRESGYASCCIAWFCAFAWLPDRAFDNDGALAAAAIQPEDRGFIPCPRHYAGDTR